MDPDATLTLWSPLAVASAGIQVAPAVEDDVPVLVELAMAALLATFEMPCVVALATGSTTCESDPSIVVAVDTAVVLAVAVEMLRLLAMLAEIVRPVTGLVPLTETPLPAFTLGVLATILVPVPVPVTEKASTWPLVPAGSVG
jgi:hypothetical protein